MLVGGFLYEIQSTGTCITGLESTENKTEVETLTGILVYNRQYFTYNKLTNKETTKSLLSLVLTQVEV